MWSDTARYLCWVGIGVVLLFVVAIWLQGLGDNDNDDDGR